MYKYITGHSRCLVFNKVMKFSQDFKKSKPKRSKRLYYVSSHFPAYLK